MDYLPCRYLEATDGIITIEKDDNFPYAEYRNDLIMEMINKRILGFNGNEQVMREYFSRIKE